MYHRQTDELRKLQSNILSYSLERFSCFSTVKLNGRQHYEKQVYAALVKQSASIADNRHYAHGSFMGYVNMATNCSLLAVLKVGGDMIKQGSLSAGVLTRFAIQVGFRKLRQVLKVLFLGSNEMKYLIANSVLLQINFQAPHSNTKFPSFHSIHRLSLSLL